MQTKNPGWKMFFHWQFFKTLWSSLTITKVKNYSQTNTALMDPQHLKAEVAE